MRVIYSHKAQADVNEIVAYIARDNPNFAAAFGERLREQIAALKLMPLRGRSRPEFGSTTRSFPVSTIMVFYRIYPGRQDVEIVRVIDGRRDLGTVFFSPLLTA